MKKFITICLLAAAILFSGAIVEAKTTKKKSRHTTSTKAAVSSSGLTAADFFDISGNRLKGFKKVSAISSYLSANGYELVETEFYPGDPDSDLAYEQDDITYNKFAREGVEVKLYDCERYVESVTIQFSNSADVQSFLSNMKSTGWKRGFDNWYFYRNDMSYFIQVEGNTVHMAVNAG